MHFTATRLCGAHRYGARFQSYIHPKDIHPVYLRRSNNLILKCYTYIVRICSFLLKTSIAFYMHSEDILQPTMTSVTYMQIVVRFVRITKEIYANSNSNTHEFVHYFPFYLPIRPFDLVFATCWAVHSACMWHSNNIVIVNYRMQAVRTDRTASDVIYSNARRMLHRYKRTNNKNNTQWVSGCALAVRAVGISFSI